MTDDAKKIDKKVIESVLNQVKEYCEKTHCEECEFSVSGAACQAPVFWDKKKIAEVIVNEKEV